MSKQGSQQFSWKLHQIPPDKRVCAHCGEKLVVNEPGGLWLTEVDDGVQLPMTRVAHFGCELESRKAA